MDEVEAAMDRPAERHPWKKDHEGPRPTHGKGPDTSQKPAGGHYGWSSVERQGLGELGVLVCRT